MCLLKIIFGDGVDNLFLTRHRHRVFKISFLFKFSILTSYHTCAVGKYYFKSLNNDLICPSVNMLKPL